MPACIRNRIRNRWTLALSVVAVGAVIGTVWAAGAAGGFARATIDIGVVVSDVEKSAKFYTEALGFTEVPGFSVPAEMGSGSGLTDNLPFKVRVFVLDKCETATRLKLMELPSAKPKKVDHSYIHSSLGYSYLTVFVKDTEAALARARKAGVEPIKKPYALKGGHKYLTLVRDPDGNIVELLE